MCSGTRLLDLRQHELPGTMFVDNPVGLEVNGSLWTLRYEFEMYLMVLALGVVRAAHFRRCSACWRWAWPASISRRSTVLGGWGWMLSFFAIGMVLYKLRDTRIFDDRVALVALLGLCAPCPCGSSSCCSRCSAAISRSIWRCIRACRRFSAARFGDLSYGLYIYGWPSEQLAIWAARRPRPVVARVPAWPGLGRWSGFPVLAPGRRAGAAAEAARARALAVAATRRRLTMATEIPFQPRLRLRIRRRRDVFAADPPRRRSQSQPLHLQGHRHLSSSAGASGGHRSRPRFGRACRGAAAGARGRDRHPYPGHPYPSRPFAGGGGGEARRPAPRLMALARMAQDAPRTAPHRAAWPRKAATTISCPTYPCARATASTGRAGGSTAVETPGHTSNHLCFACRRRERSSPAITSWAGRPASSRRPTATWRPICARSENFAARRRALLADARAAIQDPQPYVQAFIAHRNERTDSILARLAAGDETIAAIVTQRLCRARPAPRHGRGPLGAGASRGADRGGPRPHRRPAAPRRALSAEALIPRPGRFPRRELRRAGAERGAGRGRLLDQLQAQQRERQTVAARTQLARLLAARACTGVPGGGKRALDRDRHEPLLDERRDISCARSAPGRCSSLSASRCRSIRRSRFRARSAFSTARSRLPSGTPSGEAHAVIVLARRMREAQRRERGGRAALSRSRSRAPSAAKPRIDIGDAAGERRPRPVVGQAQRASQPPPPQAADAIDAVACIGERHFGAQLVERQPRLQIFEPRRFGVEIKRVAQRDDEEIVEISPLRRQQRGMDARARPRLGHVVGDQALAETRRGPRPRLRARRDPSSNGIGKLRALR